MSEPFNVEHEAVEIVASAADMFLDGDDLDEYFDIDTNEVAVQHRAAGRLASDIADAIRAYPAEILALTARWQQEKPPPSPPQTPPACDANTRTWTEPDGRTYTLTVPCTASQHASPWHTAPDGTGWKWWQNEGPQIVMNSSGTPIIRDGNELHITWK